MATSRTRLKFTYEDYRNSPPDRRYELLDGELIVVPAPKEPHQRVSMRLSAVLYYKVEAVGMGYVYAAPFDVILSDTDVVQPDLLYVSNERAHIITADNILGAPDLVVEILSPGTAERDRTFKRSLYALHGVREYWLVDPMMHTIEVLRLGENSFEAVGMFGAGETLTSPTLADFRLNLDEVF